MPKYLYSTKSLEQIPNNLIVSLFYLPTLVGVNSFIHHPKIYFMGFFQKLLRGNKGGGKMADLLQTLITDLSLDPNQIATFKQAFQSFKEQRKSIKDAGGDRSQIQQARSQMTEKIMSVLNDQQKQTFTANAAKYDGIMHGGE